MDLIFKGGLFDECGASIFGRRSCRRGGVVGGGGGVDGPVGILLLLLGARTFLITLERSFSVRDWALFILMTCQILFLERF